MVNIVLIAAGTLIAFLFIVALLIRLADAVSCRLSEPPREHIEQLESGIRVKRARCYKPIRKGEAKRLDGPESDYACATECRTPTCLVCRQQRPIGRMIALQPYDPSFASHHFVCNRVGCAKCFYCGFRFDFNRIKLRTPPPILNDESL